MHKLLDLHIYAQYNSNRHIINKEFSMLKKSLLCLLFFCMAAAVFCFAGCGREKYEQSANTMSGTASDWSAVSESDWDYAQRQANFTVIFSSVTQSGSCYFAQLQTAGEKFCLTSEGFSAYYKKEDGVYKRRTENGAEWTNTGESTVGDCLGIRFPFYGSFFDESIGVSMFVAEDGVLTAKPALLETLSAENADISVLWLKVRLADRKFYSASAEAIYNGETVLAEYLFHSYGTTKVQLPDGSGTRYEVTGPEGGFTAGGSELVETGDIGDHTAPGMPCTDFPAGEGGSATATLPDDTDPGEDGTGPGDIVFDDGNDLDPGPSPSDDDDYTPFPEENSPAIEPPGFPGQAPGIEVFEPIVRMP